VVQRFGDDRRTRILFDADEHAAPVENAVADEAVVITVSHEGFVKRMPVHLYQRRMAQGKPLAEMDAHEGDWLERVFSARTRGWVLVFTARGQLYFLSVMDVPEGSRASRGQSIYALTGASREDRIVALRPVEDLAEADRMLVFATAGGLVKRTELGEFSNPRSGGIIAAGVRDGDQILDVALTDGRAELLLLTGEGRAIRFEEREVPTMGRTAQGVKGIDLKGSDRVVGLVPIRREARILTVTDLGWGKQTELGEFPMQKRGGLGTLVSPASSDAGTIVSALEVLGGDEVTLVTAGGVVHRVETDAVPVQGRRTRGNRLAPVSSGDRVVEVTRSLVSEGSKDAPGAEELVEELVDDVTDDVTAEVTADVTAEVAPEEEVFQPPEALDEPLDSPGEQQDLFGG
jgi:DNA gyrase subunit A